MDLSPTFRHSFLQLYCGLTYQLVLKECYIKSNTITLIIALSIIAFKLIKIKSLLISESIKLKFIIHLIIALITA